MIVTSSVKFLFQTLFVTLCFVGSSHGQRIINYPGPEAPRYGVVPMQAFVVDPVDTLANDFRYLYKGMEVRFEVSNDRIHALITHHIRIRVNTLNGSIAGFVNIPLYADNDLETLERIEGRTWTGPGSWTLLDSTARRIVNVNERYAITEFSMPDVRPGVVLDYRYTIRRRYLEELPDFYLMMSQPVDYAMVRLVNSTFLRYKVIPVHIAGNLVPFEARIDTGMVRSVFQGRTSEPLLVQSWTARNIPALREEPLSGSPDDYRWRIKFQWSEFGNPRQFLESGWDVVAAEMRRRPGLESNIRKYSEGQRLGAGYGLRIIDKRARIDSIFTYVRDRANPSVNRGVTSEEDPSIVLKGQPATHAIINQVLISMLRGAGFEAWPVLTTSRDYGKILADFPSYYQFNRLLVYVYSPDGPLLLDAAESYGPMGLIPEDVVGGDGFVVKKDEYEWIKLRPSISRSDLEVTFKGTLSANGTLTGRLESRHFGYKSRQFQERLQSLPDPIALSEEFLFRNTNRARYQNGRIVGEKPGDEFGLNLDIEIPKFAVSYAEGVEFSPLLVGWLEQNPLGDGPRNLPVNLDVPETFKLRASIVIPAGFRMPQPSNRQEASIPGARLLVAYQQDGDTLNYQIDISLDSISVPPEDIRNIRTFYDNWVTLSGSRWFVQRRSGS